MKRIVVVGMGYVGLANAVLLARNNKVFALEIDSRKIGLINKRVSPFADKEIEESFKKEKLDLTCSSIEKAPEYFKMADFILICTPTNFDEKNNCFDTSSVENVLELIHETGTQATIIIKSTIPVGFTQKAVEKYQNGNILFSPEFLREGKALYDNFYPSRIVVGYSKAYPEKKARAEEFAALIKANALIKDIDILFVNLNEAESIKLFSNSYLALRVAYFNELDSFALTHNLDASQIIKGVSLDPRIGNYYNNPSFGYGGYCLPKDTKQLLFNFSETPQNLISSIVESNATRKEFIVQEILKRKPETVGIYRLTMKTDSDNFRQSSILDIIDLLSKKKIKIIIYEPEINSETFNGFTVYHQLNQFFNECDLIVANRFSDELEKVKNKVFTRDLYFRD